MKIVRSRDTLAVLPMADATRRALNAMGIETVGALFDAPKEILNPFGQARRLVAQLARGDNELGLLEWGMALPGRRGTLWWSLDEGGTLRVYGSGVMADYTGEKPAPWAPYRSEIRVVSVEEQVENVGAMAFAGCGALERVELSEYVHRIGTQSFLDCAALTRVESPRQMAFWRLAQDDQLAVGKDAFQGTPWQRREDLTFRIQDGVLVEYLGDEIQVRIPDGVREIAPMVFEGKPLESVALPKTLERIGTCAFRGTKLQEVTLPKSVKSLGEWAFSDIPTLRRVVIRNGRMQAKRGAFDGTPVAGRGAARNGRWPSLLGLRAVEEPGIEGLRRLTVAECPGMSIGVTTFSTRPAVRRHLKDGNMLLRIIPEPGGKRVRFVDAIYIHPYYGLSLFRTEPCLSERGFVEPWRDEEYRFDSLQTERIDLTGLRRKGEIWWYTVPYRRYSEFDTPLSLLEGWLRSHPEYTVPTAEERFELWHPGPADAA